MKPKLARALQGEYPWFWRDELEQLPDGWVKPLVEFFEQLYSLSSIEATRDRAAIMVTCAYEVSALSAMAFACPIVPMHRWNSKQMEVLLTALRDFHGATQETCSVCGRAGLMRKLIFGEQREGIFCEEHKAVNHG